MSGFSDFGNYIINMFSSMRIIDIIDILLVSIAIYYVIKFVRERRAAKVALGIVAIIIIRIISDLLDLVVIKFIMDNIFQIALIALIVLFQPELRSMLERVGSGTLKSFSRFKDQKNRSYYTKVNNEICEACFDMSDSKTGALIVLERTVKLGDIINTGTVIDAETSEMLIKNIFFEKSPLHDGAIIIRNGRIHAAACLLPLSSDENIKRTLGTRHRASLGMSENSDAVVIVVSEETGYISVAVDGKLDYNIAHSDLRLLLEKYFAPSPISSEDDKNDKKKKEEKKENV